MINWNKFKILIGNGKRKYLKRGKQKYHFISWNEEIKEITIMNVKAKRTLICMPLWAFIQDFEFIGMTSERPLF